MTIDVDVAHRQGAFRLAVRFCSAGRLTALFGPSGSGKTSLINVIGGLIRPDRARVAVDGTTLVDTSAGIFVPPWRRRLGYVFQDGRLFPHLTVRQNLLFGRLFRPAGARAVDLGTVVDLLGIGALLHRRPGALSGGEKQRVAIGRALLSSPRLLLMDEPLAALDEARKAEIMHYIERLRDESGIPILYVSHAPAEVRRLADEIVVLRDGRLAAAGDPADVLGRTGPGASEAIDEAGAPVDARILEHDPAFGLTTLQSGAGPLCVPYLDLPPGTAVRVRIRARDVMVASAPPSGLSALNVFAGRIAGLRQCGDAAVEIDIDCTGVRLAARLTRKSAETLGLVPGMAVHAIVKGITMDQATLERSPLSAGLRGTDLGVEREDAAAPPPPMPS